MPPRFGKPQLFAVLLLLAFLGQCSWLLARIPLNASEFAYIQQGELQWHGKGMAGSLQRSPLAALAAAAPLLLIRFQSSVMDRRALHPWRWLLRLPFLGCGLLLGASLWYVSRRLYGNAGGYIALALYCFSPIAIAYSSAVRPEIAAAWGAFGVVFTTIALTHTLYAPRTLVLWNWPRIALLGISMALVTGAQFSLVTIVTPLALGFMLYLVPGRRPAALLTFAAAVVIALALLAGTYGFHPVVFWKALRNARWLDLMPGAFSSKLSYALMTTALLRSSPALVVLFAIALATYGLWKRPRYFGNAAPLLVAVTLLAVGIAMPYLAGFRHLLFMSPFLFVFVAGIFSDLLESSERALALGAVLGLVVLHVVFSLSVLARR